MGVHQKINRAAHKSLKLSAKDSFFPSIKQINHFEGRNGPDGIKSKSTGQDEPWHFYDPYNPDDTALLEDVHKHYDNLVNQLTKQDQEKAAFEAAWLAHALVDGLTPAHHYPYEEELTKIRGSGNETRDTIKKKIVVRGETRRQSLKKNWMIWGAKGLITTHGLFEFGVATILAPIKLKPANIKSIEVDNTKAQGLDQLFISAARRIASEFSYDEFYRKGWTPSLARWVRNELAPVITKVVTLAWLMALNDANKA